MTAIERTAYPRLRKNKSYSIRELDGFFTPSATEVGLAWEKARQPGAAFNFLLQLKGIQNLGYFPCLEDVPKSVIRHIRKHASFDKSVVVGYRNDRTLYRHRQVIRAYLGIKSWDREARRFALKATFDSAQVMDNPADLINVAVEALLKERYELPSYMETDRLVCHVRSFVNQRIFAGIVKKLTNDNAQKLEDLMGTVVEESNFSEWNRLKLQPKNTTLNHLKETLDHLDWLLNLGDVERCLKSIPEIKIRHFAAIAKATDSRNMRMLSRNRRLAIAACLLRRMQIKTRDDIVTMMVKCIAKFHNRARILLETKRAKSLETTAKLLGAYADIVELTNHSQDSKKIVERLTKSIESLGGAEKVLEDCSAAISVNTNNHLPFVSQFFKSHRSALIQLSQSLDLKSTLQERSVLDALNWIVTNRKKRFRTLKYQGSLAFVDESWKKILFEDGSDLEINRGNFEACVFSSLVNDLKAGDICVADSEDYADYRDQLLTWRECKKLLSAYVKEVGLPGTGKKFVADLRSKLTAKISEADMNYPNQEGYSVDNKGVPSAKKVAGKAVSKKIKQQQEMLTRQMPDRHLLEILSNTQHWLDWTRHFGPLWGSDTKIENPNERYIVTTFAYGSNLGPKQTAKHFRKPMSSDTIAFINKRHTSSDRIDKAIVDHINIYSSLDLPKAWGFGKTSSADGTKYDVYEQNLLAEFHIRYGGYGGIAYHHVADNYIAIFTHFIPCGTWEAIYILEGLLRNESIISPETIYSDTQGQSSTVFAFAFLLGIKLMPRIRNFKELNFFRPSKSSKYEHLDSLFSHIVDWGLIENRWQDMMTVILSVRTGKISSPTILRKLGNYSRKNSLYKAFRELGQVVRTMFLLDYLSDSKLRSTIDSETNKVESYHNFSRWMSFGGDDTIRENDPEQQEKIIKYNQLLSNAVILQNTADLTNTVNGMKKKGVRIDLEAIAGMSPYMTRNIKRFGYFDFDVTAIPECLVQEARFFH